MGWPARVRAEGRWPRAETYCHHCVILSSQALRCWGSSGWAGAQGSGDTEDIGDQPGEMPPASVPLY